MGQSEYGIFTDEGCVEEGFYERESAEKRAALYRKSGDTVVVHEMCPEHDGEARATCEECDSAGCSQYLPRTIGDADCGVCGYSAHEHRNLHTNKREG